MDSSKENSRVFEQHFDGFNLTVVTLDEEVSAEKPSRKGVLTVDAGGGSAYFTHTPAVPRKRNKRLIRTNHLSVLESDTGHYSGTISFDRTEKGVNNKLVREFMQIICFLFDKKNGHITNINKKEN